MSKQKKSAPRGKSKKTIHKKISITKTQQAVNRQVHKTGYYKKQFTGLAVEAVKQLNPHLDNKRLAKEFGMSEQTLKKVITGKKVSKKTYKKISNVLGNSSTKEQLKINLVVDKLKTGTKKVNIKAINKKVQALNKKLLNELRKNKEYLYIRLSYEQKGVISEADETEE